MLSLAVPQLLRVVCSGSCPLGSFFRPIFVRLFRRLSIGFIFRFCHVCPFFSTLARLVCLFYCFCPLVSAFVRLVRFFSPLLSMCTDLCPLGSFLQAKTLAVVFALFFSHFFFRLVRAFFFSSFFCPFSSICSGFCPLGSFLQAKALAELVSKREADGGAEVLTAPNMSPTRIPQGTNIKRLLSIGVDIVVVAGGCGGGGGRGGNGGSDGGGDVVMVVVVVFIEQVVVVVEAMVMTIVGDGGGDILHSDVSGACNGRHSSIKFTAGTPSTSSFPVSESQSTPRLYILERMLCPE